MKPSIKQLQLEKRAFISHLMHVANLIKKHSHVVSLSDNVTLQTEFDDTENHIKTLDILINQEIARQYAHE